MASYSLDHAHFNAKPEALYCKNQDSSMLSYNYNTVVIITHVPVMFEVSDPSIFVTVQVKVLPTMLATG